MRKGFNRMLTLALAALLAGLIACTSAFAATPVGYRVYNATGDAGLLQQLNELPPFKFAKHKKGIGYGLCPVYTAPSTQSYRTANGRSSCQTNAAMDEAGFVNGWLLVRYETNKGVYNVGYIPPKYVQKFRSSMGPHFGSVPAMALKDIPVTTDPMNHNRPFATLEAGESFTVLSKYNYYANQGLEWWYVEFDLNGQTARGFIDLYAYFQVGYGDG